MAIVNVRASVTLLLYGVERYRSTTSRTRVAGAAGMPVLLETPEIFTETKVP